MKVVVGYHQTDEGRAALKRAIQLAQAESGVLIVVGFVPPPRTEAGALEYQDSVRAKESEISAFLDAELRGGVRRVVEVPKAASEPADAILAAAAEHGGDLIVIGLRDRSRVGKLVLGSAAQSILLGSTCDVLGVKCKSGF